MLFSREVPFPDISEFSDACAFDVRTHNGFIAVTSGRTGAQKFFHIFTKRGEAVRFVSVFVGGDKFRADDWRMFGVATDGGVRVFRKLGNDTALYQLADVLNRREHFLALGSQYLYVGRCRVCNRPLANADSLREGIGAECKRKRN